MKRAPIFSAVRSVYSPSVLLGVLSIAFPSFPQIPWVTQITSVHSVAPAEADPSTSWTIVWDGKRMLGKIPRQAFASEFIMLQQVVDAEPSTGYAFIGMETISPKYEDLGVNHVFRWQEPAHTSSQSSSGDSITLMQYQDQIGRQREMLVPSQSFHIVRREADGTIVFDMDTFFMAKWRDAPPKITAKPGTLQVEVAETGEHQRVVWNWSFVQLPVTPMRPRLLDDRIGFLTVPALDEDTARLGKLDGLDSSVAPQLPECANARAYYVTRWRLEKRDPHATFSDVVKPIVYYIDPNTPGKWLPWVKRAVEEWLPAFEAAGFHNAVVVREAPKGVAQSHWSPTDLMPNVIYWSNDDPKGLAGITHNIVDPHSGEILHTMIYLYPNTTIGSGIPDSIAGRRLQALVAHEVGHSLGLAHNFGNDKGQFSADGSTPSIMSYDFFNGAARLEDHIPFDRLFTQVNLHNRWVIFWGYKPIPAASTPAVELPELERWRLTRVQDTTHDRNEGHVSYCHQRAS